MDKLISIFPLYLALLEELVEKLVQTGLVAIPFSFPYFWKSHEKLKDCVLFEKMFPVFAFNYKEHLVVTLFFVSKSVCFCIGIDANF